MTPPRLLLTAFLLFAAIPAAGRCDESPERPLKITIDARALPRKLVDAQLTIPLAGASDQARQVALWYPKWVPGSHGPGGPIANVGGLQIEDIKGRRLRWVRTPGEVYRIEVEVPAGVDELRVQLRYITDQPTTTSFGHDCFSAPTLGLISPGCLLLYPESAHIDRTKIRSQLLLPSKWQAATALPQRSTGQGGDKNDNNTDGSDSDDSKRYRDVTLRTFVDSPIMCGPNYRTYNLVRKKQRKSIPPHQLHVFGDSAADAELNPEIVKRLRAMVSQTARLIGSHPFDRFDILLGVSNKLPANGLEHSRSTMNVLPPASLRSPESLKGWNRLLIPHEFLHAWCGKYRRPEGMLTPDFHSPKDTELLWVYEGLTQYLGELVEARCGLMTEDEFRDRLTVELRNAAHLPGRQWRTLADTGSASYLLRQGSPNWGELRRSQDYYMEGMLFWLEADARIRQLTDGAKSLDDFCHEFLGATENSEHPKAFSRDEIVDTLNRIAEFDWDGLIRRRVESYQQQFDASLTNLLGYRFELTEHPPKIPPRTFRRRSGIDAYDSLGVNFSSDGVIRTLRIGGPADRAGLSPGMKIIGVNGRTWSGAKLQDALQQSAENRTVDLLTITDDRYTTIQVDYDNGPRYWNLIRDEGSPDVLERILKPRP